MALRESRIAIQFAGGIETKMDSKAVPTTRLLTLQNGVFTRAVSIQKRNGYEDVSLAVDGQAAPIGGMRRFGKRDDELLVFTGNRCYSQQPSHDQFVDAGPAFSVKGSDAPGVLTGTMQTMPDHATNGGVTAYAWEDSRGGVWWASVDSSTGRVCRAPEQLDAQGSQPRCVPCGDVVHVYWANTTQRSIFCIVCNPATPSAAVTVKLLVQDLNTSSTFYDAEPTAYPGAPAILVWSEFATFNIRIAFVHPSGVLGAPSNGLPTGYREPVALTGPLAVTSYRIDGSKVAVAVECTGAVKVFYYTFATAGGVTSFVLDSTTTVDPIQPDIRRMVAVMMDATDPTSGKQPVWVAWETRDIVHTDASQRFVTSGLVNATAPLTIQRGVGLASRAFQYGGDAFAMCVHDTTYSNVYLTLRLSDYFPVGRHLAGSGAGLPTRNHVSSAHYDGSIVRICVPFRERLLTENHDKFRETGIRTVTMDFASDDSHVSAQLGRGLYLAGACPLHYDGHVWTEQGFHMSPDLIPAPTPAAGGSMSSSGKYEYQAWYEWTDNQGEVHRGPTSIGTTVTMGGSDTQVTLTLPTLRVTQKQNVRICLARSKLNDTSDFFRVTSLDPTTAGTANGYIANDPTVDTVTFVDKMDDTTLAAQEDIYTVGGIPSNDPATLGDAVAVGKSRLFFTDASDPQVVRFSQEIDVGYGAEIPPDLQMRTDPYGGAVTGLGVMDEFVIITKEHALHTFGGDGPTLSGDATGGAGFSRPELITSDAGCTDPNSIVLTPVGMMFKSAKGIMQVDRSRQVTYIGAPVEAFNGQTIRRATLLEDRTAVIFLTDSGSTLYYDYRIGQWSVFTNHEGLDAVMVAGSYYYLRTDGRIFRETPGVYTDAGRAIPMRLETAWIKMSDVVQSWQRFYDGYLLGERKSAHLLKVQYRLDFGKHWSEPQWCDATGAASPTGWVSGWAGGWSADVDDTLVGSGYGDGNYGDGNYGGTPPEPYQWRVCIAERAQAIQFRFEDYELVGSAGPSFELTELLITGGIAGPAPKPFTAARSV